MSNGGERTKFDLVMRGYDKRQVDQYMTRVDAELASYNAERERARGQMQTMAAQLQQLQAELGELRQRPPIQLDKASFRDLGPMVDQILALAEKQAGQIMSSSTERAASRQADAEKTLADARERAEKMRQQLETELGYACVLERRG